MKTKLLLVLAVLFLVSCGAEKPQVLGSSSSALEALQILGSYEDSYNSQHKITSHSWVVSFGESSSTYEILSFDNEKRVIIALNGEDSFNPGEYSRFEWVYLDSKLFYCQSVYDGETMKDAEEDQSSSSSDPMGGGCGSYDFPWTPLNI
ncbi:MAG: hypothetical protein ACJAT2_000867 [Bacteriovoracaceae bacterium]|jgi:hypothetical protein